MILLRAELNQVTDIRKFQLDIIEKRRGSQASPISNTTLYYLVKDLTDNILELESENRSKGR